MSDQNQSNREKNLPQDSQVAQKKAYQKPVVKTEIVQFEKVGTCLKQTGGGSPCKSPRRS